MDYIQFLTGKRETVKVSGFEVDDQSINPMLFLFQRDIVRWALALGKAAIFAECGLGKTPMQLEWARHVTEETGGKVLILAPLAVSAQTVREGVKFGIAVDYVGNQAEVGESAIVITNYERLGHFDPTQFTGVVLDESSILKAFTGSTKRQIIESFRDTPYKLACTATPAPNDHMELGNHADFLDIMPSNEMISRWFINNAMSAGNYRLKHHAAADFWRWLTSWAVCLSRPGDLGEQYEMPGYDLPGLDIREYRLKADAETIERAHAAGRLLPDTAPSSTELSKIKRESMAARVEQARAIVEALPDDESIVIWCDLNDEADALQKAIPEAVEIRGSHSQRIKAAALNDFSEGRIRILITKAGIAGFGMNWQHCANPIFVGANYSFERFYQSLRRSYRFGQERPVTAHMIVAETEGNVMQTLQDKQKEFEVMQSSMNEATHKHGLFRDDQRLALVEAIEDKTETPNWTMYLGDCVPVTATLPDHSIDFCVHSPPFANLYIYSDNEADMGNSADDDEFFDHYEFLIQELYRIMRPGRLCAVHCKDLPLYMNRDGAAGLRDFPGEIIRRFEKHGWTFHSRVTIWKDPVIEMQRTKNHGLLHKNFESRAQNCRQGMADYLIVMGKKLDHPDEVDVKQHREIGDYIGTNPPTEADYMQGRRPPRENYSISVWQRYASPVWFDIDQTNVLNYKLAREGGDEKHIAPLQMDVIERSIDLWTNPGEVVFSPFAGIGSEGVGAIRRDRKFIGVELKRSYYDNARRFLEEATTEKSQLSLFDVLGDS